MGWGSSARRTAVLSCRRTHGRGGPVVIAVPPCQRGRQAHRFRAGQRAGRNPPILESRGRQCRVRHHGRVAPARRDRRRGLVDRGVRAGNRTHREAGPQSRGEHRACLLRRHGRAASGAGRRADPAFLAVPLLRRRAPAARAGALVRRRPGDRGPRVGRRGKREARPHHRARSAGRARLAGCQGRRWPPSRRAGGQGPSRRRRRAGTTLPAGSLELPVPRGPGRVAPEVLPVPRPAQH